jgi:dTDP-4-amino-4,6-dideoxygalactose transaminase
VTLPAVVTTRTPLDADALAPQVVPLIDLAPTHELIRRDLRAAFERVLASGAFAAGREVVAFEQALAGRLGVRHVVGVASGTAALHLALVAGGIGAGDEVIVPTNSFFATAGAVFASGATPVFADVNPETAGLDPASVEAAITPRTAGIVAVHLYGIPADMEKLRSIADRAGLLLVEDVAQALGASWNRRPVGALSDVAAFSFYPTKNLGALGEGGAVATEREDLARRVARLRSHGESAKDVHVELGFNERMHELQAAFLRVKLGHLDSVLWERAAAVAEYQRLLDGVEAVSTFSWSRSAKPAHHLFVVCVQDRDRVLTALREDGIGAAVHYRTPIHLQPACAHLGFPEGSLPHAENLARTVLSLPLYPGISDQQIAWTVGALIRAVEEPAGAQL